MLVSFFFGLSMCSLLLKIQFQRMEVILNHMYVWRFVVSFDMKLLLLTWMAMKRIKRYVSDYFCFLGLRVIKSHKPQNIVTMSRDQ